MVQRFSGFTQVCFPSSGHGFRSHSKLTSLSKNIFCRISTHFVGWNVKTTASTKLCGPFYVPSLVCYARRVFVNLRSLCSTRTVSCSRLAEMGSCVVPFCSIKTASMCHGSCIQRCSDTCLCLSPSPPCQFEPAQPFTFRHARCNVLDQTQTGSSWTTQTVQCNKSFSDVGGTYNCLFYSTNLSVILYKYIKNVRYLNP